MKPIRILFANIGWMTHYQGINKSDQIQGGGAYNNENKHETYNFKVINGYCYGYVEPPKDTYINLSRIDDSINNELLSIEDVLVVWTATRPDIGGTYIIGWYKHATVFRQCQSIQSTERQNYSYNIKSKENDCVLLPIDDRYFRIPRRQRGFIGQSNVWYADSKQQDVIDFRVTVLNYIKNYSTEKIHKQPAARTTPKAKKQVESSAINYVTQTYKNKGYTVTSVEKENLGWDLEAERDRIKLRIEVKGLASNEIEAHLTPNEYKKMKDKNNSNYRLCIVTNALTTPILYTFIYDNDCWICEDDAELKLSFNEHIAAIAFVE